MIQLGSFTDRGVQQAINALERLLRVAPIPSLRLDDFDQMELLRYLRPIQRAARKVSFGVGSYTHGATASNFAYDGGVLDPIGGRIYLVPNAQANQANWHYINIETGAVVAYANGAGLGNVGYRGGVYSPTQNRIYFVPCGNMNAEANWQYIDCSTQAVQSYAHGATVVVNSYVGGAYLPSLNRIYMSPFSQAPEANWHYIDCDDGSVVAYDPGVVGTNMGYRGAVWAPTLNRIYFVPYSESGNWVYVDESGNIVEYTHVSIPGSAYVGGVYSPTQNRIYFIPFGQSDQSEWHYIDCDDDGSVVAYEHGFGTSIADFGYAGGAYDPVLNRIWMAPAGQSAQSEWHYIDCDDGSVVAYEHGVVVGVNSYAGVTFDPTTGRQYLVPADESDQSKWHYIQGYADIPVSRNLMAGPLFNKL
jgi:hypothetical protein